MFFQRDEGQFCHGRPTELRINSDLIKTPVTPIKAATSKGLRLGGGQWSSHKVGVAVEKGLDPY